MPAKYFVKFVPFSNNTISCLINRTIKFSTVYEFNDFNELHYSAHPNIGVKKGEQIDKICKEKLNDIEFKSSIIRNAREHGCEENFLLEIKEFFSGSLDPVPSKYWPFILEHMAYSSVGIFCVSNISIFKDDSAQLMFAHYAQNLKGLALIYEISTDINEVRYNDGSKKPTIVGKTNRVLEWIDGVFEEMGDFLTKSIKWEYELEYRLFSKPDLYKMEKHYIKPKIILYTSKFSKNNLETLDNINKKIYNDGIKIEEIYPSDEGYYFIMRRNKEKVFDWLLSNFQ